MGPHISPMTIYLKVDAGVACQFRAEISTKSEKVRIYHCCVPKYVASGVNCSDCIITYAWHYNGITQKPHDHLFKKSRQAWLASFALKYRKNLEK